MRGWCFVRLLGVGEFGMGGACMSVGTKSGVTVNGAIVKQKVIGNILEVL